MVLSSDVLVVNKQLAAEIEFDLRKFEEEQQRQEQPREVARRSSMVHFFYLENMLISNVKRFADIMN